MNIKDQFLLKTRDTNGCLLPEDQWVKVTWTGLALVDDEGCTWNEWFTDDEAEADDIVPLKEL